MNRISVPLSVLAVAIACASPPRAPKEQPVVSKVERAEGTSARPAHWGYTGELGPSRWFALSPAYSACRAGRAQSPVDIRTSELTKVQAWQFDYKTTSFTVAHHEHVTALEDNGHTIQVTVDEGGTLRTGLRSYALEQIHFHTPSEHTVDGKQFPMEVHFVHKSDDGHFGVVAFLFIEGEANPNLAELIPHLPEKKGVSKAVRDRSIDLQLHLPESSSDYTYMGSFTSPPCTEGVEWLVFEAPVPASAEQLSAFSERLGRNNRPVQPLNGRPIGVEETAAE